MAKTEKGHGNGVIV